MGLRRIVSQGLLALAASPAPALAAVEVTGVEGELLENVDAYIDDVPDCNADADAVRGYAAALPRRVRPALRAFGYYEARLETQIGPRTADCWGIVLAIEPGRPVRIRDVSIELDGEARSDAVLRALVEAFPLPRDSILRHGAYELFKSRLEALADARGYFDARFTRTRIDVYPDAAAAEIALTFDSGPRYAFGRVRFETEALSERALASFLSFDRGEPYDASQLAQLQRELAASGYFTSAHVTPEPDAARDLQVPIRVSVDAAEPTSYSVGAGFSTDDGPRFRFAYENRRRMLAGHQMNVALLLARVRQNATFDYRIPVGNPQRDWVSFRAGIEREEIDAGVSATGRLGVRRTRVGEAMTVTRFIDVLSEQDDVGGHDLSTQLLVPGISWARAYRDDLVRPREGHRLSFEVSLGVGDVSLVHADLRGKWVRALRWDARIIMRGRAGVVLEDDAFDRVPLSMRFFAGGDNSIRGYDHKSIGPHDAQGELIGGNRLLEGSIEYEHPIRDDWSAAVFVDAGDAFIGSDFQTRTGVGIGARWFSPIGPVRLDIAWPLDSEPGADRSPRLHISLGPDL